MYLVRCKDNSLYCGQTNNLEKRIREHNFSGSRSAKYIRSKKPVELIYYERYNSLNKALRREWEIKQLSKNEKELLIQTN